MPAKSKAQHGIMGMALALKRGKVKVDDLPAGVRKKVAKMAADMSESQLEDYTSTPSSRLPKHKSKGTPRRIRNVRS